MALINCPECGKEVSEKAVSCPHCGFSVKTMDAQQIETAIKKKQFNKTLLGELTQPKGPETGKRIGLILWGIILVLGGIGLFFVSFILGIIVYAIAAYCLILSSLTGLKYWVTKCPHCNKPLTLGEKSARKLLCPHCKRPIFINAKSGYLETL